MRKCAPAEALGRDIEKLLCGVLAEQSDIRNIAESDIASNDAHHRHSRLILEKSILLFRELQERYVLSFIVISRDLAVVRALVGYVIVMKSGDIAKEVQTRQILDDPRSDYAKSLMEAAFDLKSVFERLALHATAA